MKILVTGAGSLIGHGILRSIRAIRNSGLKVLTADPDHRAAGHWLGDHALTIPMAREDNYLSSLSQLIERNGIDVLFVGTDPELIKVSRHVGQLKAKVVISSPNVITIGEDKWETVSFLKANGFPFPATALLDKPEDVKKLVENVGFPLIAKPRIGARSVGVRMIQKEGDLKQLEPGKKYLVQEYLPDGIGEFTAGTMTYEKSCISQVIFRRDLKDGNTYRAYAYEDAGHEQFLKQVSERMEGVYGPLNFQYRVKDKLPVIFEINPRFSGTTPLRTAIGVNEIEMALQYLKSGSVAPVRRVNANVAIFRTWSDIIVPVAQLDSFGKQDELPSPTATYFPFYNL